MALITSVRQPSGAGPILVGNGAGTAEYAMVFVGRSLPDILRECRDLSCGLSAQEKNFLSNLIVTISRLGSAPLLFKRGTELKQNVFILKNAEVWINQDKLWLDIAQQVPYDFAESFALWLEIETARSNMSSVALPSDLDGSSSTEEVLNSIQNKARAAFRRHSTRGETSWNGDNTQTFGFLLWNRISGVDQIALHDPAFDSFDLTEAAANDLRKQLACVNFANLHFFSPAWLPAPSTIETADGVTLYLTFGVRWACDRSSAASPAIIRGSSSGRVILNAKRNSSGVLSLNRQKVFVHIDTGGLLP